MNKNILYYPYINVPNSLWFSRMLLYWDEVGAIIPYDFIEDPTKLNSFTRDLLKEELVKQIIPGQHIYDIPRFKDAFEEYMVSLNISERERRHKSFSLNSVLKIHIEKMGGIEDLLKRNHLASPGPYPWWYVEKQTAFDFMAYLAATLGKIKDLSSDPISDESEYLIHFFDASQNESKESEINSLRVEVLDDLFPAPGTTLTPQKIRSFKDKYGSKYLAPFRFKVEKELIVIADIADPLLKERRLEIFKEESKQMTEEIVHLMRESGFSGITASKLVSVVCSIPGISQLFGMAKAVYDAFKGDKIQTTNPAFLYAAYAQEKLLCK